MTVLTLPFTQVDVFSGPGLRGNPLAVVHDADGVDTETMKKFADWSNLSEATFLVAPTRSGADYRVRIFAGREELPFAGHPTLGTAAAWLAAGVTPRDGGEVVQECEAGLVRIRYNTRGLSFAAPELTKYTRVEEELIDRIAAGLRIARERIVDASWLVNGPNWIGVLLSNAEEVLALDPDGSLLEGISLGVAGAHPPGAEAELEVRAFFVAPGAALIEDPVTGSLNAGLARWLIDTGRMPLVYTASQGARRGRAGRISVEQAGPDLWIGGAITSVIRGTVTLDVA